MNERSKVAEYMDIAQSVSDELYRVTRQRDALLAALKGCDAYQRASLYERCNDCDYPGRCSRETGCRVCEREPLPHIVAARAAITEAERPPAPETKV